jgi:hypothetical protein
MIYCLIGSLCFFTLSVLHPIHTSVCSIDYNNKTRSFEIIQKIFVNDLEVAIEKKFHTTLKLGTVNELKESNKFIDQYVNSNYILTVRNKTLQMQFIGKEIEGDDIWVYYEIKK